MNAAASIVWECHCYYPLIHFWIFYILVGFLGGKREVNGGGYMWVRECDMVIIEDKKCSVIHKWTSETRENKERTEN